MPAPGGRSRNPRSFHGLALRGSRPRSLSQKNVNSSATTVTAPGGCVGNNMPAHPPRAEPAVNVLLENRAMLVGMATASVNHADAGKARANRFQQELFQDEPRFLKIQTMQIHVRLHG